ncbi:hypothetical protein LINPERPRIM_LOCUS29336, partial [Linum perenne]
SSSILEYDDAQRRQQLLRPTSCSTAATLETLTSLPTKSSDSTRLSLWWTARRILCCTTLFPTRFVPYFSKPTLGARQDRSTSMVSSSRPAATTRVRRSSAPSRSSTTSTILATGLSYTTLA